MVIEPGEQLPGQVNRDPTWDEKNVEGRLEALRAEVRKTSRIVGEIVVAVNIIRKHLDNHAHVDGSVLVPSQQPFPQERRPARDPLE